MPDFSIGEGDLSPALTRTLIGDDGDPINLTGCSVKFNMAPKVGDLQKISAPCTITDEANGAVEYDWDGNDTDTPATYVGEFQVTLPSGNVVTVPNATKLVIEVVRAVG